MYDCVQYYKDAMRGHFCAICCSCCCGAISRLRDLAKGEPLEIQKLMVMLLGAQWIENAVALFPDISPFSGVQAESATSLMLRADTMCATMRPTPGVTWFDCPAESETR